MSGLVRQAIVAAALMTAGSLYWCTGAPSRSRGIDAGFWFDDLTFDSSRLGGPLTRSEIKTIESVAHAELREAFSGLPIVFSERRDARYTIRVVQELLDLRFKRPVGVAGQSRGIPGLGGSGSVSFDFLAKGAMAWAPDDADRAEIVAAIGRGIGRTAVHEFTHQLLPKASIHDSRDEQSYEYASAARRAQYFGPMRWERARPLLQQKIGG